VRDWRKDAACLQPNGDPNDWDGPRPGEPVKDRRDRYTRAIAVCVRCPVKQKCADDDPDYKTQGVWAGEVYGDPGVFQGVIRVLCPTCGKLVARSYMSKHRRRHPEAPEWTHTPTGRTSSGSPDTGPAA
jgi:hypothetical protein